MTTTIIQYPAAVSCEPRDFSSLDFKSLAHELKTPLTVIRGAVELLQAAEVAKLDAQQSSTLLTLASRNAERLAALVDELLAREATRLLLEAGPLVAPQHAVL